MTMNRQELEDALDAYVLDVLDEEVSRSVEEALDRHRDLSDRVADMRRTVSALAFGEAAETPISLRRAAMDAALAARDAGVGIEGIVAGGAVEAYRETSAALDSVLSDLDGDGFRALTSYGRPVVELVAHLSAVEAYCQEVFGLKPNDEDIAGGHLALVDRSVDLADPGQVVSRWRQRSDEVLAHIETLTVDRLNAVVTFHGITLRVDQLLAARAFELWTHTEDILRAVERPLQPPSSTVLRTMVETAMSLLSTLLSDVSGPADRTVRITLTGSGGGSWVLPAQEDVADVGEASTALLVADIVDFCRYVAGRIQPAQSLPGYQGGDESFLQTVMELAPTMAEFGEGGHEAEQQRSAEATGDDLR